jgi:hypothetical protein
MWYEVSQYLREGVVVVDGKEGAEGGGDGGGEGEEGQTGIDSTYCG